MKIQLISIGITNNEEIINYASKIIQIINAYSGPTIFVLPEYCWGNNFSYDDIIGVISKIQNSLKEHQYLLAGSYPKGKDVSRHNVAELFDHQEKLWTVEKTHVLSDELERNKVQKGNNPGVVEIEGLKIAIVICADIWDNNLLNKLIKEQGADILLIPAFTVVPKEFGNYARTQWHSLAIVRSREYLIPIVIADHHDNTDSYSVGGASCIVDPSKKTPDMNGFEGFLELPEDNIAQLQIDLNLIQEYKKYRIDKGLYSEKII